MSIKKWIQELIMPIFFAVVSITVMIMSRSFGEEGTFPTMVAVIMLLCSIYIAIETIVKKEMVVNVEGLHLGKVLLAFGILIVYTLVLKTCGYIISTFFLCAFIVRALGYKNIVWTLACSLLTVIVTFVIFKVLLTVPLPMILLDF